MSSLILVFEHIGQFSFFGFLYPQIGLILISFIIYFAVTVPIYFKEPKGLVTLLIGILFILMHSLSAQIDHLKSSVVFISFVMIALVVAKNSDPKKLRNLIKIILFCCLLNLIYAIYSVTLGELKIGRTFRVGGLDQTTVLFGYNMLLGFWLSLINPIFDNIKNKVKSNINRFLPLAFIIGILLSQSRGAIAGLLAGTIFLLLKKKN